MARLAVVHHARHMSPLAAALGLRARLPRWVGPLALGVLCLFVYNANLRTIGAGDTLPARYQPLILLHDGKLDFSGNERLVEHGHPFKPPSGRASAGVNYFAPKAYWLVRARNGQLASLYPVVAPLLVAPLYLPAALILHHDGWKQPQIDRVAELMEKISASLLAAIASVLMFLILRREGFRWALPLTLAFAFATDTWMISSQALWQHGSGELLVALALFLTLSRSSPPRTVALGFVCMLVAANRPPDVLIAGAFVAYTILRDRRDALWLLAGAVVPLAALLYYNVVFIGQLGGAYAVAESHGFFHVAPLGIPGLLVSPTRGLLVFSPFLLFVPLGLRERLRAPNSKVLAIALAVAVALQFVVYSSADWRAGVSWGSRWLTDLLPILVWMLAPVTVVLRPSTRRVFGALIVFGIVVQTIGAFWYTKTSDDRIFAKPGMSAAWDPVNTPFIYELRHSPAPAELQCGAHGAIELVGTKVLHDDATVAVLRPNAPLQGWATTCRRSPAQVVLLIDGRVVGTTTVFTPRPDVNRAIHSSGPAGWAVLANTRGIAPGRHVLQLAVRVEPRSDIRIVREERVRVPEPPRAPPAGASLRVLAARAAQRLRADQSDAGYWLTDYTSGPRFTGPKPEMNTYLTSVLVDLLTPIAGRQGLDATMARARGHLAAQIESTGLVRYHGLPNGPTIGTLGCVITPDSDDTSLVWRIAGPGAGDPRFRRMLRTLSRYRTAQGLYRTWLAPVDKYQCLDPGHDPDPADIVIQMHVWLMLRTLDPPAARRLCTAIQRSADRDDVWVYYAKTALVPYLRSFELRQLGCPVPLPKARLANSVPGQRPWADLVRRLVAALASRPDPAERRAIGALLERLGRNDFALARQTPPLLYHNDLSASVNRFYWSRDAGYALWLRLYEAAK
jgi:hypothetical protein